MSLSEAVSYQFEVSEKTTALGHRQPLSYSAPYLNVHVTILFAPHLHSISYFPIYLLHKDDFILDMQFR